MGTRENSAFPVIVPSTFFASNPPTGTLTAFKKPWYDVAHPTFGATNAALNVGANAAVVQANADGGGLVFIGPGSWTCNTGPVFPLSAVTISGAGIDITIILANGALTGGTADLFRISQNGPLSNYYVRVTICNMTLDDSAATQGNCMTLQGFVTLTLEALRIIKSHGYGFAWGSVAGATPYSQNALARRIYCEGCSNAVGNDSIGGGGIQGGILEDYFCLDAADGTTPGGTAFDLTNLTGFIVQRAFARSASVTQTNGAFTTDFGATGLTFKDIWVFGWKYAVLAGGGASGITTDLCIDALHVQSVTSIAVFFNVSPGFAVQTFKILNSNFELWDTGAAGNPALAIDGGHDGEIAHNTFGAVTTAYAIRFRGDSGSTSVNPPTWIECHDNDVRRPTNTIYTQFIGAVPTGINIHHNPGFTVANRALTAGASPWTYTNNDGFPEKVMVTAVNGMTAMTYRGQAGASIAAGIPFDLNPGESIIQTWATTAPTNEILQAA